MMTEPKKKSVDGDSPMNSKKFVAYMLAEFSWKAIIVLIILSKDKIGDNIILLTIVLIAGFIETAYILGQAYVDRYMRIADNAFDKIRSTVEAAIPDVGKKDDDPVPDLTKIPTPTIALAPIPDVDPAPASTLPASTPVTLAPTPAAKSKSKKDAP